MIGHRGLEELAMAMAVTELAGDVTCVRLSGRLDAPGADQIGVRFTATVVAQGRNAVVDLSGVTFIASLGMRLLIASARGLATKGTTMVVFGAPELVQNALEQAALDQIIAIVDTEAHALQRLAA
jgi:anti-sigma B factor antagonist